MCSGACVPLQLSDLEALAQIVLEGVSEVRTDATGRPGMAALNIAQTAQARQLAVRLSFWIVREALKRAPVSSTLGNTMSERLA